MNSITKVMIVSVFTNIFLAIGKIITGFLFYSSALIADGIHSFSDLATDFFSIIGNYLAKKPADHDHPFGHGKIEYLTSLVIGIVILIVGLLVIYKAGSNDIIIPSILVVIVSIITIVVKLVLSTFIIKKGQKYNNNILIASGKESRTDVLSSIVVLVSSILIQFSEQISFLKYSDLIASIIVGVFIVKTGFNIVKENASVILGEQEQDSEYLEQIQEIVLRSDIVIEIKNMIIVKYGHIRILSMTILMQGDISLNRAHNIVDIIEKKIKKYDKRIQYINIHMEPVLANNL